MAGAARALSRNDDLVTSRNAVAQLALITVGSRSRVAIEIIEVRHTRLPIEAIKETLTAVSIRVWQNLGK
jgi:hypothetical protein